MDKKPQPNYERRTVTMPVEFRAKDDTEPARLVGYAAVFNSRSEDLGGFYEQIAPGAFGASIKDRNIEVKALFNHDPNLVLGSTSGATLKLTEDETGLRCEIIPPDTTAGRDVMTLVARGDINKMSFGFQTVSDDWQIVDSNVVRTLIEVKLFDVSPVTYPAYPDTAIAARSLNTFVKEKRAAKVDTQAAKEAAHDLDVHIDQMEVITDRLLAALGVPDAPEPNDSDADDQRTRDLDLRERELRIREAE